MYEAFAIIFSISAILSYVNNKWLKLPSTIGQMIMALFIAIIVIVAKPLFPSIYNIACDFVMSADFSSILLDIMLGFLLFAGALHVDLNDLKEEKWPVFAFATFGVLLSTTIVGISLYSISSILDCQIPFSHCLLFGALISPTDPVAVLSILNKSNISKSLQLEIEGESLFNDGVGVVVFSVIMLFIGMENINMQEMTSDISVAWEVVTILFSEVILGILLGLVCAVVTYHMIKNIPGSADLATIVTLALVFGGYSLANSLHTSGPLAMVVAGLYLGNKINKPEFDKDINLTLSSFWKIVDESLNGVLFVLIGFAIHLVSIDLTLLTLGLICIVVVLIARFVSVIIPYSIIKKRNDPKLKPVLLLTWGGLRGGISLALVFSLDPELSRNALQMITYIIVIFSIIFQGLTISRFNNYLDKNPNLSSA